MTCDSIGGVWKWAPNHFIPSMKTRILKGSQWIHCLFFISSACRTEFGLLLGGEVKKKKKQTSAWWKVKPSNFMIGKQNTKMPHR